MTKILRIIILLAVATSATAEEHINHTGKSGVEIRLDDKSKIPDENKQNATRISLVNNQIIVPVVFRNNGRIVKARMILDTGASVTTIYSALASELNLNRNKLTVVRSISANGANTDTLLTKVDLIEVDDKLQANAEVVIMPVRSKIGADGLLGNSFLRFFKFTIDYDNRLLRWN